MGTTSKARERGRARDKERERKERRKKRIGGKEKNERKKSDTPSSHYWLNYWSRSNTSLCIIWHAVSDSSILVHI